MRFTLEYDDIRYNATDIMSEMHSNQHYKASVALMMLIIQYNVNWACSANLPFHESSMLDVLYQNITDTVHTNPLKPPSHDIKCYFQLLFAMFSSNKCGLCLS